eukprot:Clim_evm229s157 gene=Clim_evmTU229s157
MAPASIDTGVTTTGLGVLLQALTKTEGSTVFYTSKQYNASAAIQCSSRNVDFREHDPLLTAAQEQLANSAICVKAVLGSSQLRESLPFLTSFAQSRSSMVFVAVADNLDDVQSLAQDTSFKRAGVSLVVPNGDIQEIYDMTVIVQAFAIQAKTPVAIVLERAVLFESIGVAAVSPTIQVADLVVETTEEKQGVSTSAVGAYNLSFRDTGDSSAVIAAYVQVADAFANVTGRSYATVETVRAATSTANVAVAVAPVAEVVKSQSSDFSVVAIRVAQPLALQTESFEAAEQIAILTNGEDASSALYVDFLEASDDLPAHIVTLNVTGSDLVQSRRALTITEEGLTVQGDEEFSEEPAEVASSLVRVFSSDTKRLNAVLELIVDLSRVVLGTPARALTQSASDGSAVLYSGIVKLGNDSNVNSTDFAARATVDVALDPAALEKTVRFSGLVESPRLVVFGVASNALDSALASDVKGALCSAYTKIGASTGDDLSLVAAFIYAQVVDEEARTRCLASLTAAVDALEQDIAAALPKSIPGAWKQKFGTVPVPQKTFVAQKNVSATDSTGTGERPHPYLEVLGHVTGSKKIDTESQLHSAIGKSLAAQQAREDLLTAVRQTLRDAEDDIAEDTKTVLGEYLAGAAIGRSEELLSKIAGLPDREQFSAIDDLAKNLEDGVLDGKHKWLVLDMGKTTDTMALSAVNSFLSSRCELNLLIVDTDLYSGKRHRRTRDIGLYAMQYGNAYVASIAMYASYTQTMEALAEAQTFHGPSVVLAYYPAAKEGQIETLKRTKEAIDNGWVPLYRWNPEQESPFTLDTEQNRTEIQQFLDRFNHLSLLSKTEASFPSAIDGSVDKSYKSARNAELARAKQSFDGLLSGMNHDPVTILYGSDGGNAEKVAFSLTKKLKSSGVPTVCIPADDFDAADLSNLKRLVIILATAGQGEYTMNSKEFGKAVASMDESLENVETAIFGLGDRHYWPGKDGDRYFCKPAKDVDKHFKRLGAQELVETGLGDDQDDDGYQTKLKPWEGELMAKLGLDASAVSEPPPKSVEDIKDESNYLRGTILQGLQDRSTGAISASDAQLTKFHGIYMQDDRDLRETRKAQGMEKAFSFMVRVRVPGGITTSEQWLEMDRISDELANGTLKLTTRQAYQLHGVLKYNLKASIQGINRALMDTLAACGDVNRNVMCNPNPFQSKVHAEVQQFVEDLSAHLTPRTSAYHEIWLDKKPVGGGSFVDEEPIYGKHYLPRKFKIAVAIPPNNDVDVFAHCLGFIAVVDQDENLLGFNVTVGGGMGMTHGNKKTFPRTADVMCFAPVDKCIDIAEKVVTTQRDYGDRTNRKHARLKYTIDDRGIEWFKAEVESRLGYKLEDPKPFRFTSNSDRYGWTQGLENKWHYGMYIENGRVLDKPGHMLKTALREVAKVHTGDFRLTSNQNLIIGNVEESNKDFIEQILQRHGCGNQAHSGLRLNSMACVALPTCALAMAESERYLPSLVTRVEELLDESGLRQEAITIRMTGCPNGCARPYLAEIAFVGKAPGTYNMYLGASHSGDRLNKLFRESLKEDEIIKVLRPIIKAYSSEKREGEHFGDFVIRQGYIKPTIQGRHFHDDVNTEGAIVA